MAKAQFRVLYRQFLFRMVDVELLSAHAQGDLSKLFGQFATLLIFAGMLFSIPALGFGGPPLTMLRLGWQMEHFLIATTMLAVGLFAVVSWDAMFPDRRDVLVLGPLPVRARTLFLTKAAAVASALALTVCLLHAVAGLVWPFALSDRMPRVAVPALTAAAALPPLDAAGMEAALNRDLPGLFRSGALPPGTGLSIGIYRHGEARILSYGTARADSIFAIGSITKTFSGLALARMAAEHKVRLDEPVRDLLPAEAGAQPTAGITLLDLATHRSGLPPVPANLNPGGQPNPGADYNAGDLYDFISTRGLAKPAYVPFQYSNLGFGLLGQALANRAGTTYAALIERAIAAPLGMRNTVVACSPEQTSRAIQGYNSRNRRAAAWQLDALAGAGAILSTAGDMLAYLEANLHPEKIGDEVLRAALAESHRLRAEVIPGMRIGLGWMYLADSGIFWHNGALSGFSSDAFFDPAHDSAAVVLLNRAPGAFPLSDLLGRHIRQRFRGEPAVSLAFVTVPARAGILAFLRTFAAWWITMLAAGGFIFSCVLALQGLAALVLPRPALLRVSSFLQMAAFGVLVIVYFLQPTALSAPDLIEAQGGGAPAWSPSYWFLGLLQQLSGSPALAPLAHRAWAGLAAAVGGAAGAYALSYCRTFRQIIETPDIVRRAGRAAWLPRFGGSLETAIAQFTIRTLSRSRRHRVILAFYLGVAFAISIYFLKRPGLQQLLSDDALGEPWRQTSAAIIASTIAVMTLWVIGLRVVLSLPLDLRANWIFRAAPVRGCADCTSARRRALLAVGVAPVCAGSAIVLLCLWPWAAAAAHVVLLALWGMALAEICTQGAQRIPFTCSYLPGKANFHVAFWLCAGWMVALIGKGAEYELRALEHPARYAAVAGSLALLLAAARWRTVRLPPTDEVEFESTPDDAVIELRIGA